jgi:hypothetical protein
MLADNPAAHYQSNDSSKAIRGHLRAPTTQYLSFQRTRKLPQDTGISYTLDFYQGNTLLLYPDYKPTGCGGLSLGDDTSRLTSTSFNDELRKAVGLSDSDFYGR